MNEHIIQKNKNSNITQPKEREPMDANKRQRERTIGIDLSSLSDEDRRYYLTYGKLPEKEKESTVSKVERLENNDNLSKMSNKAQEMLADFIPHEIQHTHTPTVENTEPVHTADTAINTTIPTPTPDIVNDTTVVSTPTTPSTEQPEWLQSWDDPSPTESVDVINTNTVSPIEIKENIEITSSLFEPTKEYVSSIIEPDMTDKLNSNVTTIEEPQIEILSKTDQIYTENLKAVNVLKPSEETINSILESTNAIEAAANYQKPTEKSKKLESRAPRDNTMSSVISENPKSINSTETKESTFEIDAADTSTTEDTAQLSDSDVDLGYIAPDEDYRTIYKSFREDITKLITKYHLDEIPDEDTATDAEIETFQENARKYQDELKDPTSNIYLKQRLSAVATANRDFEQAAIGDKDLNKLMEMTPSTIRPINSSKNINTSKLNGEDKVVKGKQARMLVLAKLRGTKRVFLNNSGFYVDIRPLSNLELGEYINTLRTETADYGRDMGMHFYLYASLYIKKFFIEKLPKIVVGSNLQGWSQTNVLVNNISLQDFKTILWACASLMYKDGVNFTKVCAFCENVEKVVLNLDKLRYTNFEAIKDTAYPYIAQKKNVTPADIVEYKKKIDFGISPIFEIPEWRFIRKVPSLMDYLNYAEMFLKDMTAQVKTTIDSDEVKDFVRITHHKQYSPWIERIQCISSTTGELQFTLEDIDSIYSSIDTIAFDYSKKFMLAMEEYIQKTMLTYIAFPYIACPKCNKVPNNIQNGFVAYDIESAFFTMSVRISQEQSLRSQE